MTFKMVPESANSKKECKNVLFNSSVMTRDRKKVIFGGKKSYF